MGIEFGKNCNFIKKNHFFTILMGSTPFLVSINEIDLKTIKVSPNLVVPNIHLIFKHKMFIDYNKVCKKDNSITLYNQTLQMTNLVMDRTTDRTKAICLLILLTGDRVIGGIVGVANDTTSYNPSKEFAINIKANLFFPFGVKVSNPVRE